jgi:class 3 adenylate cyclase
MGGKRFPSLELYFDRSLIKENYRAVNLQEWAGVTDHDPRATLAIVFTDIIDSTTLARDAGDAIMFDMLISHFETARSYCVLHDGFEIKLIGDAYMVVFRTADPHSNSR